VQKIPNNQRSIFPAIDYFFATVLNGRTDRGKEGEQQSAMRTSMEVGGRLITDVMRVTASAVLWSIADATLTDVVSAERVWVVTDVQSAFTRFRQSDTCTYTHIHRHTHSSVDPGVGDLDPWKYVGGSDITSNSAPLCRIHPYGPHVLATSWAVLKFLFPGAKGQLDPSVPLALRSLRER